jgi:hypothetical protein
LTRKHGIIVLWNPGIKAICQILEKGLNLYDKERSITFCEVIMADRQEPRFSKERWGFLFQYTQIKMRNPLYLIISLIIISGCVASAVPRSGRLYDMDKGIVIEALIEDARKVHGRITAKNTITGEIFQGEYNSIRDDVAQRSQAIGGSLGSTSGSVGPHSFSQSGHDWAMAFGFSFEERNRIYGAATMVGDKNTIIEAVYSVDRQSLHGYGVARDNQGGRYKLHF